MGERYHVLRFQGYRRSEYPAIRSLPFLPWSLDDRTANGLKTRPLGAAAKKRPPQADCPPEAFFGVIW